MSNASSSSGHGAAVETEALLQRVSGMIAGARALPLSSSVKLDNKDEVLELLREAVERLPEELRGARWMLKEREEYLAATQRKADELVEAARSEAQRLVQRTEIIKEAQTQARHLVEEAREEASRLRLEAEDYADQKLAQFEIVLERTLKTVASGRQKLAGLPEREEAALAGEAALATPEGGSSGLGHGPFDQRAGAGGTAGPAGAGGIGARVPASRWGPGRGDSTYPGGFPRAGHGGGVTGGAAGGADRARGSRAGGDETGARGRRQAGGPARADEPPGGDKKLFDQDSG